MSSVPGVVLVDDRAPPLEHLTLHLDRAGRRGVDGVAQARQVVARSLAPTRQLQHPHEHRGDELGVGHPVALDQLEAGGGVEVLHHHDGGAQAEHRHANRRAARSGRAARATGRPIPVPTPAVARPMAIWTGAADGSPRAVPGSALRTPLGFPVVPDEYSISRPSDSSSIGVDSESTGRGLVVVEPWQGPAHRRGASGRGSGRAARRPRPWPAWSRGPWHHSRRGCTGPRRCGDGC